MLQRADLLIIFGWLGLFARFCGFAGAVTRGRWLCWLYFVYFYVNAWILPGNVFGIANGHFVANLYVPAFNAKIYTCRAIQNGYFFHGLSKGKPPFSSGGFPGLIKKRWLKIE